jgi:hypothetical protein
MSPIQKLLAALRAGDEAKPKASTIEVTCEQCGHTFDVEADKESDDKKEPWKTDSETGKTSGDDPEEDEEGDDEDDFEDNSMSPTPKNRADRESAIAASLLKVVADRKDSKPSEPSVTAALKAVAAHAKNVKRSDADVLADALKKVAKESRR